MNCKIEIGRAGSFSKIEVFDKNENIHLEYNLIKKSDLLENKLGPVLNSLDYKNELSIDIITKIKQIIETITGEEEIIGKSSDVIITFFKKIKPEIKIKIPYFVDEEVLEINKIDDHLNSMFKRMQKLGYTNEESFEFSSKINKIKKIILS